MPDDFSDLDDPLTAECERCGKHITLKPFGNGSHFKWFDNHDEWHCRVDPKFPVMGHAPAHIPEGA